MYNFNEKMNIAKVIYKQIIGDTLTEDELLFLKRWMKKSKFGHDVMDEFYEEEYWEQEKKNHQLWSVEEGITRFRTARNKIVRKRVWRWLGGVAAVVLVFVSVVLILSNDKDVIPLNPAEIYAGTGRACLVLSDGRNVELTDSLEVGFQENEAIVNVIGKEVVYNVGDTVGIERYNIMSTPCGGEFMLQLSDGSRVWLNAASKLKFPVSFSGKKREVELIGEAYFEVQKDSLCPFVVRSGEVSLEVLGTSFSVASYHGEPFSAVLVEGSICVTASQKECILKPGEKILFENGRLSVCSVDVDLHIAWKDKCFGFENAVLEEVVQMLERWYGVDFLIMDEQVRGLRFTGKLPKYDNLDKVLEILQLTTNIRFVVQSNRIEVYSE